MPYDLTFAADLTTADFIELPGLEKDLEAVTVTWWAQNDPRASAHILSYAQTDTNNNALLVQTAPRLAVYINGKIVAEAATNVDSTYLHFYAFTWDSESGAFRQTPCGRSRGHAHGRQRLIRTTP